MKGLLAGFALAGALVATAAQAQINPTGHIAYTGNSVEFEGGSLNNSTVLSSLRYIYEFNGLGSSWTRIFRPPVAPEGLGVTTLPDGRRCIFWIESENLRTTCELNARWENWGAIETWPQPLVTSTTAFRFKRIAVLGPANEAGAASGQIPMLFAISPNTHFLLLRQYRNGSWGSWLKVRSLFFPTGNTPSRPVDISAAWDPDCAGPPPTAIINIAAGPGYHRLWVRAGAAENFGPVDVLHAMPDFGEPIARMAPLPNFCAGEIFDWGHSLYVTNSGALNFTISDVDGHRHIRSVAIPAPVRAIHVRSLATSNRMYMLDVNGNAWMSPINTRGSDPPEGVQWTLME